MAPAYADLNLSGSSASDTLRCLVDTRATFTKIPVTLGQRLGLEVVRQVEVELADGRVVVRQLASPNAEMEGISSPILVTLAEEEDIPLIGVTTLEVLGFKVDPGYRTPRTSDGYRVLVSQLGRVEQGSLHGLARHGRIVRDNLLRP